VAAARPCARTAGLSRACLRWLAPQAAPQPPPSASGECWDEAAARRRACARRALCSLGVAGERTHAACALGRALGAAEAAAADAADEADCGRAARDRALGGGGGDGAAAAGGARAAAGCVRAAFWRGARRRGGRRGRGARRRAAPAVGRCRPAPPLPSYTKTLWLVGAHWRGRET
jgi:hypothetical protein